MQAAYAKLCRHRTSRRPKAARFGSLEKPEAVDYVRLLDGESCKVTYPRKSGVHA